MHDRIPWRCGGGPDSRGQLPQPAFLGCRCCANPSCQPARHAGSTLHLAAQQAACRDRCTRRTAIWPLRAPRRHRRLPVGLTRLGRLSWIATDLPHPATGTHPRSLWFRAGPARAMNLSGFAAFGALLALQAAGMQWWYTQKFGAAPGTCEAPKPILCRPLLFAAPRPLQPSWPAPCSQLRHPPAPRRPACRRRRRRRRRRRVAQRHRRRHCAGRLGRVRPRQVAPH